MRENMTSDKKEAANGNLKRNAADSSGASSGWMHFWPKENAGLVLTALLTTIGLYCLLIAGDVPIGVNLGTPARKDYRARVAFESVDLDRTRRLKERARQDAPMVFRWSKDGFQSSRESLVAAVQDGEVEPIQKKMTEQLMEEDQIEEIVNELEECQDVLETQLDKLEDHVVLRPGDWKRTGLEKRKPLVIVNKEGREKRLQPTDVVQLDTNDEAFQEVMHDLMRELPEEKRDPTLRLLAGLVEPNAHLDRETTQNLADEAAGDVGNVVVQFPKDSIILRSGTEVRRQHIVHLKAAREAYRNSALGRRVLWQKRIGLGVVLLVLIAAAGYYIYTYRSDLMRSRLQRLSFAVLTLAMVGVARILVISGLPLLLTPVPLVVMVMCLVYDQRFGFEMAVFYALLVGLAQGGGGLSFVVLMLGSMTAAFLTGNVRHRGTLIKSGLVVGGVHWAAAIGLGLLTENGHAVLGLRFWQSSLFQEAMCGLGNGVMSGFLVSGLLPAIERLFGVTTDIRLLEWSDPNQPLLQRLLLEAPGTYHHSMLVGGLAADAADEIGANGLLARVSAYFHDIGKLKKPRYFGENIPKGTKNPHDELSPTMSKLILTAHPRDGADMAERAGMPQQIQDVILESHGSTMTKFFWSQAQEEAEEGEEPEERTFRYRLPKPQSKEAACVMLADSSEGATRSLDSPTSRHISDRVHSIIMERLHDGQLDDSGLTITDLSLIEKTLVRGLNAVFHKRVKYPSDELPEMSSEEAEEGSPEE